MTEKEQLLIFQDWLEKHKALLFKVVRAYTFNAMDRDDLFQEITIQVWHSVPGYRGDAAITTWLYRIALNTAIKWIRKEKKHAPPESLEHAEHLLELNTGQVDERLAWLYEEIHSLDPLDRSLTLLMLDNFSYKEMSSIMGISESNVGVKINRIKKFLISKSKQNDYHGI